MIDCGEGSYGQLLTLYGHEMLPQFLTKIRAIFITHAHLDHTLGTTTVILKRQEEFLKLSKWILCDLHAQHTIEACFRNSNKVRPWKKVDIRKVYEK